jgi:hypothetical protein
MLIDREIMSGCEHQISGSKEKIWLPYYHEGLDRGLKPHPYCKECGLVRNLSSDGPHGIGYFLNVISELGKHYDIARVQKRLIAQEMEKQSIDDSFGIDRQQQEKLFIEITTHILNVPARAVSRLL